MTPGISEVLAVDLNAIQALVETHLSARFGNRSFFVFSGARRPVIPIGDVFIFGTMDNLNVLGSAYDASEETPPTPTGGSIVSYDAATKVVWVTGYSSYQTLNRKTVEWQSPDETTPSTWFLGLVRPERFLPLAVADICVEDYTDPVAASTAIFTYRDHWDKYGCVRIHNGNRANLEIQFESGQTGMVLPAYGTVAIQRTAPDGLWGSSPKFYTFTTAQGTPATYQAEHPGQQAGCMATFWAIMTSSPLEWARIDYGADQNDTSKHAAYLGYDGWSGTPATTDLLFSWLFQRGRILSVVLDKRDGAVVVKEIGFSGYGSGTLLADFAAGDVTFSITGSLWEFESTATAPTGAGPTEWAHELIPVTTNLLADHIISLPTDGSPVSVEVSAVPISTLDVTNAGIHAAASLIARRPITNTGGSAYPPWTEYTSDFDDITYNVDDPFNVKSYTGGGPVVGDGFGVLTSTLADALGSPAATDAPGYHRSGPSLQYVGTDGVGTVNEVSGFDLYLLNHARQMEASGTHLTPNWTRGLGYQLHFDIDAIDAFSTRNSFTVHSTRKYHVAGLDAGGGSVTYLNHPRDKDVLGTTDGLGLAMGVDVPAASILESQVRIEGPWYADEQSIRGRFVHLPVDALHHVVAHLHEAGWWNANRDRVLAGTLSVEEKRISYRPPRTVNQYDDLYSLCTRILAVKPIDITLLHKDPLPVEWTQNDNHPFAYVGENAFAVPADWMCGRYDGDTALADWAAAWGIALSTTLPDIATLRAASRSLVIEEVDSAFQFIGFGVHPYTDYDATPSDTVENGQTYNDADAMRAAQQRLLFGGSGTEVDYAWLSRTNARAVFDDLGIAITPGLFGERFNPTVGTYGGLTHLYGDSEGSGGFDDVGSVFIEGNPVYRLSNTASGTWLRVVNPGQEVRMIDTAPTVKRRVWHNWFDGLSVFHAYVVEIDETEAESFHNILSPYHLDPQTVAASTPGTNSAWPTVQNIWGQDGGSCRLVYSEEGFGSGVYATDPWVKENFFPPNPPTEMIPTAVDQYAWTTPDSTTVRWRNASGSMPITPETLRGWTGSAHSCWHCQIIPTFLS